MASQTKFLLISVCRIALLIFISALLARSDKKPISSSLALLPSCLKNRRENVCLKILTMDKRRLPQRWPREIKGAIQSFIASITNALHNHFCISWTCTNALTIKLVILICHIRPEIVLITLWTRALPIALRHCGVDTRKVLAVTLFCKQFSNW